MTTKIVILADIISSKKFFNSENSLQQLKASLNKINKQFYQQLHIPFEIVAGDSFGGVAHHLSDATEIVFTIQQEIYPLNARIVLVQDEIIYNSNRQKFNEISGKALWKANDLITSTRKNKLLFSISLPDEYLQTSLHCVCNLILEQKSTWKTTSWNINKYYQKNYTQQKIADILSITQQYVSQAIKKHKIDFINKMQNDILDAIKKHNNKIER